MNTLFQRPQQKSGGGESQIPRLIYTSASATRQQLTEVDRKRLVDRYTNWLNQDVAYARTHAQEICQAEANYAQASMQTHQVGKKEITVFAPFRASTSALQTITTPQLVAMLLGVVLIITGLFLSYIITLTIVMAVITVYYLGDLLLNFVMSSRSIDHAEVEYIDEETVRQLKDVEWPSYTVLCPLYKEAAIIPQFVQAMQRLDYPVEKLQILLLTETDDPETREALDKLNLPEHFTILTLPPGEPRTKPRACNFGLMQATGEFVVIYDAEDVMDPLQLKRAVLAFAHHGSEIVCVQARLNFYNPEQNLLTRWFTAEYSSWFDLILPGMQRLRLPMPLGGTSNHFRTEILRALGGWDAFNVTEDCDLGLRLSHYQLDTVVLDSTTYEEANSQFKNWLRQRSRWIKGYMQTYLVHMRHPIKMLRKGQIRLFISLQLLLGGKVLALFLNPILWLLVFIYFAFRPLVENFYHQIFPAPVLYMGTTCLVFGNFFFIYTHLFGCLRRQQYSLVKYALLIPFYWLLISLAGGIALFQLVIKPHYWEKTLHGLHLKSLTIFKPELAHEAPTVAVPRQGNQAAYRMPQPIVPTLSPLPTVTNAVKAVRAPGKPASVSAFTDEDKKTLTRRRMAIKDVWFALTIVIACCASLIATTYYLQNNMTLLYGDAYSHVRLSRSVMDSLTPGFAQLGGVWLPLHHVLMFPFIWNYTLWQNGLAGTIPSMIAYVVASIYLYLILRNVTHHGSVSFIGTLAFMLNPNILYLQATPLSELESVAFFLIAIYYFLCWVQKENPKYLVLAALGTFASTLTRYDGWMLFVALLAAIVIIGLWRRYSRQKIEAHLLIYGTLGFLGMFLWMLWDQLIFGDFLYFQHSEYSSQAQQLNFLRIGQYPEYHNLWQSFIVYGLTTVETFGIGLAILAVLGILLFYYRNRFTPLTLVAAALFTPFVFYILTQFTGQSIIFLPGYGPAHLTQLFNVRYGAQMVAPLAFFIAVGIASIQPGKRLRARASKVLSIVVQVCVIAAIIVQMVVITNTNLLSLNEGLYGTSCYSPARSVQVFLAQHYNGGLILTNEVSNLLNPQDFGANFKDIIYEGSGPYWKQALANPSSLAQWVVIHPNNPHDVVANRLLKNKAAFLAQYSLVQQGKNGLQLYKRNDVTNLADRPVPARMTALLQLCSKYQNVKA